MKTRHGFISNSSSSSFVLVTALADHQRAMAALSDKHRKIMERVGGTPGVIGVDNLKVWIISGHSCDDYACIGQYSSENVFDELSPEQQEDALQEEYWDTSFFKEYRSLLPNHVYV